MPSYNDEIFMDQALAQAREALAAGEFPVGCVLTATGGIVAGGRRAHSRSAVNEIDHAEILALRDLLSREPDTAPSGLTIYSTMEPCLMCYATLLLNGVRRFVYAYEDPMGGGTCLDLATLTPLYREMRVEVVPYLRRAESLALFKEFFANPANPYWRGSLLAEYTLAQE
jgi:tRNA(adenine34) deaminase